MLFIFTDAVYFPSFEFVSGGTPLSSIFTSAMVEPFGSMTEHFTLLIALPPFVFTITDVIKLINGLEEVVNIVSLDLNRFEIVGEL